MDRTEVVLAEVNVDPVQEERRSELRAAVSRQREQLVAQHREAEERRRGEVRQPMLVTSLSLQKLLVTSH